jgi:dCTP deaminase
MMLTDRLLREMIEKNGLLTGYDAPTDWDSIDSLVQPSSIDLHVGAIFRPGIKPGKPGSAKNPKEQIALKTGETAIVETKETISLSSRYAGFGFPPADVSSRGLLMTNPGHIDPGYKGTLSFTVINMGREEFLIYPGLRIVTILVFELPENATNDYASRRQQATKVAGQAKTPVEISSQEAKQDRIDLLSSDFLDVSRRAGKIARDVLGWSALAATLVAAVSTSAVNYVENRVAKIDEMETRLVKLECANTRLEKDLQSTEGELNKQIDLDHRLTVIEQRLTSSGSPAPRR